ncbi:uncharacterized protein LOC119066138 [Bradysia coprophila]|uniref:uncharacterized protein LOC119066138 n=1 Tax=Bradysia coprophila TaxID=38358 RepID=UPI00187DBA81|nr:uncharacterized protein LOC119066138 [Bradysia coprophila]
MSGYFSSVKNVFIKVIGKNGKQALKKPQTAIEQLASILDYVNLVAYPCNQELTKDWQMAFRGKLCLVWQLFILCLDVYSGYILLPHPLGIVMSAGVAFSVTIIAKFVIVWYNQEKYYSLVAFIIDVFHRNKTGLRERMLFNTTQTIFQHFKVVRAAMSVGITLYSCYPLYDFFFRGNLTKVSPIMFPYLDDQVLQGYLISCALNIVWVGWSLTGVYAVSCMFLLYVDVYDALVSLVEDDLNAFDAMWETKCVDIKGRKLAFRNIVMEFMDIARYSVYMNERFNFIATIQMGSTLFSLTTVLFGILKADYISGIGASVYYVTEILTFSFIGQIMQDTTDRIGEVICNTNWYNYDVSYQQDLMLLLGIMQNVSCVRICNVYPLNFELGLSTLNTVYNIFMFLINSA